LGHAGDRAVVLAEIGSVLYEGASLVPRWLYVACNAVGFALTPLIPLLLAPVSAPGRCAASGWFCSRFF
jgi:hypothetical protein